jgi:Ca2+:H+ antiporter
VALVLPSVYANALAGRADLVDGEITSEVLKISRATAVILLFAFCVYVWFQTKTHDNLYADIFEADEEKDADRHKDLKKAKLTLTECVIALVIALACVSLLAIFLVQQIDYLVEERHVSDAFVGLILLPLVEKAAGKSQPFASLD